MASDFGRSSARGDRGPYNSSLDQPAMVAEDAPLASARGDVLYDKVRGRTLKVEVQRCGCFDGRLRV